MTVNRKKNAVQFEYNIDTDKKTITLLPQPKTLMHFDITSGIDFWPFDSIAMLMNPEMDDNPTRINGILWGLVGEQEQDTTRQDFIDMHCFFEYEQSTTPEVNGRKPFTLICYDGSTIRTSLSKREFDSLIENILAVHQKIRSNKGSGFNPMYPVPLHRELDAIEAETVLSSRKSHSKMIGFVIYGFMSLVAISLLTLAFHLGSENEYFYVLCAGAVTYGYMMVRVFKIRCNESFLTLQEIALVNSKKS
ncbi:hypothetical protein JE959_000126 [Aeromonas veronii]|nr:hypothetical protein [Aeromonas veronii]